MSDFVSLDLYRFGKFRGVLFEHIPVNIAFAYLDSVKHKASIDGKTYRIYMRWFDDDYPPLPFTSCYVDYCRRLKCFGFSDWSVANEYVSLVLHRYGKFRGVLIYCVPFEDALNFLDAYGWKIRIDGKSYRVVFYHLPPLISFEFDDFNARFGINHYEL